MFGSDGFLTSISLNATSRGAIVEVVFVSSVWCMKLSKRCMWNKAQWKNRIKRNIFIVVEWSLSPLSLTSLCSFFVPLRRQWLFIPRFSLLSLFLQDFVATNTPPLFPHFFDEALPLPNNPPVPYPSTAIRTQTTACFSISSAFLFYLAPPLTSLAPSLYLILRKLRMPRIQITLISGRPARVWINHTNLRHKPILPG